MEAMQPLAGEHPFEDEAEAEQQEKWGFERGDEIVPGLVALEKLGGGNTYEAYLTWDDHRAFLLVAKIVRPHLVEEGSALRGLEREAKMLLRLDHPLIARGYTAVVDGPRPYLLMEHLEGPHLARLIRRQATLPLEQFLPLALDICSALHYLANEEIVHLDVKPRNIVMGAPPKLIDFSVARTFKDAKRINARIGTDLYMAPEQCDADRWGPIGAPADVWGLGVTLYHAIKGQRPFSRADDYNRDDVSQRYPQLHADPDPLPKQVPPPIAEVLFACLQREPALRPTAIEVALALEPFVAALPRKPVLGLLRPRFRKRRSRGEANT